jgi:hypothetical protein
MTTPEQTRPNSHFFTLLGYDYNINCEGGDQCELPVSLLSDQKCLHRRPSDWGKNQGKRWKPLSTAVTAEYRPRCPRPDLARRAIRCRRRRDAFSRLGPPGCGRLCRPFFDLHVRPIHRTARPVNLPDTLQIAQEMSPKPQQRSIPRPPVQASPRRRVVSILLG